MKITDIQINNYTDPEGQWWENVKQNSKEPLIQATMKMEISWDDYSRMLTAEAWEPQLVTEWKNLPPKTEA